MSNIRIVLLAFVAALSFAGAASAQSSKSMSDMPGMSDKAPAAGGANTAAASELAEGEIRKVDRENKKLTIKHGPLKNLDMPGMTMVFQVKEDTMLDKVEVGAKVRFNAEKLDGKFVVTDIEAAR
ncbi:copper-binding protein [Variovorax sp. RT4R15]|uniref:copper-binding protein n=1 Tax=Variovorax sp. RT4R15 TaxID=3443737 RepID=UPI003F469AF5